MNKPVLQPQPAVAPASRAETGRSIHPGMQALKKVPEVTVYFWIVKLLTTAMGESTSDYLINHFDPKLVVVLGGIGLVAALLLQLAVRRYIAGIYWSAAIMVAIVGTMVADVIHVVLGISYLFSSIFFAIALTVIFVVWYASEKTLSIHSIYTLRRELFYWAAIMVTFALGTALGDLTAATFGLGYFTSAILFAVLIAIPALGYFLLRLNGIFAFWFAYIVTRPLGASFADWAGKPSSARGLGLGDELVSLVLALAIIAIVGYLTVTRRDVERGAR